MLPEIVRFKKWLRRKAPLASTHIHYANDLDLFFIWAHKSPEVVKVQDIDLFIEHCQQEGHAIATVNRRLAALRSFYHFLAIESDHAPRNPVIPKHHFIRLGQQLPRDIQDPDLEKLFAVISGPRDRAMFLLMLRCGLRVGEVRNLSLGDLYLEPAFGSLPRLWLHGKGCGQRVVYLSSQPLAALQIWLEIRPKTKDQAVFLNRFGRRLSVTAIQKRLGVYCRQAGLWVTCHQLRHTFGRHMTEARMPVTTIQKLLGHSRLQTTQVYLHISDSQVQEDYESAMQEVMQKLSLEGEKA
jgi:site-specific recombinase XerC